MAKVAKKKLKQATDILTEEKVIKKSKPTEFPHGANVDDEEELDEELEDLLSEELDEVSLVDRVESGDASDLELAEIQSEIDAGTLKTDSKELVKSKAKKDKKADTQIKARGELDAYGFGSETQSSFVLAYLEQGTNTKAEIADAFIKHFAKDNSPQEAARKKSSMSVFFSDVSKPFGSYHASRSLTIVEDKETHHLSLEPKRMALVKKAIEAGILTSLKGHNKKDHPEKVAVVLKKYGLPVE